MLLALLCSLAPAAAEAAFAGSNGPIAFSRGVVVGGAARYSVDLVQPGGGAEQRLIAGGQSPAWAPDGRHLAYVATGPDGRERGIALANADGGDRRMVTRDRGDGSPAWSPDGRWLVFHRARSPAPGVLTATLQVVRVDGARRRRIATGLFPAWGPGGWIAFGGAARPGIHLIRPDGTRLRRVTAPGRTFDEAPDWSPDGSQLVFARGTGIYTVRADGRRLRRVVRQSVHGADAPAWSPDGDRIAYTQLQSIRTVRPNGTGRRVLTQPSNDQFDAPDWQPVPAASRGRRATVSVFFGRAAGGRCDRLLARRRTVWAHALLRGALDALLWGPSAAERAAGAGGWFSSKTAAMLRRVRVAGGVAHVDFRDLRPLIPNASSSCGSAGLLAQLDRTVTQFPQVRRAVYSINGSARAFYEWLQREPPAARAIGGRG